MQLLYALEPADEIHDKTDALKTLKKQLNQSCDLFIYLLFFLTEVARYAEKDAQKRATRNLPSSADLNVNTKISGNSLLWAILESPSFKQAIQQAKPGFDETGEEVKKVYQGMAAASFYLEYIEKQGREKGTEKDILSFVFTDLMLANDNFVAHVEEHFNNWDDDAEMMNQLMHNYLQKPASFNLQDMVGDEKWKFAKGLLQTTTEKKEFVTELIKPKLKNWDAERIAVLDMILMRMGVCEFLYFETVPTKVTINEYIDIAKEYSTPQSGQFVNGILDTIHKELMAQGKIHKIDFKQKTN
jgi:N utilization substance protein B